MFDFFKEVYLQAKGVDVNALENEKKKEREEKRKNKFIFSKSTKVIILVFGVLYLIVAWSSLAGLLQSEPINPYKIIRFIFLVIVDVAAIACLLIGKKKTEIAALILIIVFVLTQYSTLYIS